MPKRNDMLTLEKLEISKRLGGIEKYVAEDGQVKKQILKMVETHDRILLGTNGIDGMKIEMDRINQKEKARTWQFRTFWAAITGLAGNAVWNIFKGGQQ